MTNRDYAFSGLMTSAVGESYPCVIRNCFGIEI